MRKYLTEAQRAKYLANGGTNCPVCESDSLTVITSEFGSTRAYIDNKCEACGVEFTDTLTITDVELCTELEEDDDSDGDDAFQPHTVTHHHGFRQIDG